MTKLGLTINEAKTSLRNARQERFDFLGYSFGAHRFEANGNWYLGASPSKKSVQRFKTRIGDLLGAEQYRSMARSMWQAEQVTARLVQLLWLRLAEQGIP